MQMFHVEMVESIMETVLSSYHLSPHKGVFSQWTFYSCVCICMFCSGRHPFTFSIKHLRDVQELFSHLEGRVQVTDGVVLQRDTSLTWLTEHERQLAFASLLSQTLRKEMIARGK